MKLSAARADANVVTASSMPRARSDADAHYRGEEAHQNRSDEGGTPEGEWVNRPREELETVDDKLYVHPQCQACCGESAKAGKGHLTEGQES